MPSSRCMCGVLVEAPDSESLVRAFLAHTDEVHAELRLGEVAIRNYVEAEARISGSAERVATLGKVEIRNVGPETLDDVLDFFDHHAFAGNPAWAACYCVFHQRGGPTNPAWGTEPWRENRAELARRIAARTTTGMLAYVDGQLAAWVNASARSEFPALARRDATPDAEVCAITCFVVAAPWRRHGLARRLLAAVAESLGERGFRLAEAYPRKQTRGTDASEFHGPLALYEAAGFRRVDETDDAIVVQRPSGARTDTPG